MLTTKWTTFFGTLNRLTSAHTRTTSQQPSSETDLVFDLIEDAATDVPNEERDYLNNAGIHQIPPTGSSYCEITLVLRDTPTAPIVDGEYNTHIPNYDTSLMPIADYEQGVATKTIGVKVTNVPEQVPDYAFDAVTGFSFNGVTNVMTGTYIPVTVTIDGAETLDRTVTTHARCDLPFGWTHRH